MIRAGCLFANRGDMGLGGFGNRGLVGVLGGSGLLGSLDGIVNLLAMHWKFGWRLDADFDRIFVDAQNLDDNPPVDNDAFVDFAGED